MPSTLSMQNAARGQWCATLRTAASACRLSRHHAAFFEMRHCFITKSPSPACHCLLCRPTVLRLRCFQNEKTCSSRILTCRVCSKLSSRSETTLQQAAEAEPTEDASGDAAPGPLAAETVPYVAGAVPRQTMPGRELVFFCSPLCIA